MNDLPNVNVVRRRAVAACAVIAALLLAGCKGSGHQTADNAGRQPATEVTLQAVDLSNPIRPVTIDHPIELRAARNEWTSFTLQAGGVFAGRPASLRITAPPLQAGWPGPDEIRAYQVLSMPVEVNPGFVRHTGLSTASRSLPRALLPLGRTRDVVSLGSLRDPTQPTNSAAHPNGNNVLIWVDVHVPPAAQAGDYQISCDLLDASGRAIGSPVGAKLGIDEFDLPNERHLKLVGQIGWDRLAGLQPDAFGDTITPSLINRADPRYEKTVRALDRLVSLGEAHRTGLVVPGLRPTVKWPAGEGPQIDWREFDSVLLPWMRGDAFADGVSLQYWPIPAAENLARYDAKSRLEYWTRAAEHFQQRDWLDHSAVQLRAEGASAATEAARIVAAHSKVRVAVPLSDDQLAAAGAPAGEQLLRVITASPGLVSSSTPKPAAAAVRLTQPHWLRTESPGLGPYTGAADERDVRLWAWLAFLRRADLVVFDSALPALDSALEPADPGSLVWFYPGQWFGVSEPLPTIQLKWLRRAEQDYEYLWLARDRGEVINALQMARLITKPVEIQPDQQPDPVYSLMSGTIDPRAWEEARSLLARTIMLRKSGQPADAARQRALYIQTLQWAEPQERPFLLARSTQWTHTGARKDQAAPAGGDWLRLQLGLDIYNASDNRPNRNALRWSELPPDSGWEVRPQPLEVPQLQTYHAQPATLSAEFNLLHVAPLPHKPVEIAFVNGFSKGETRLKLMLPVAVSDRREGPMAFDGKLGDWSDDQAIQDGPLVLMLNRPDIQRQQIQFASAPAKLYSAWGGDNFMLAFSLEGLAPDPHQAHNDVYYQARRAWGEDLCEALIQPVYSDNSLGPVLHVVCKPNGADWVEQKSDPSKAARPTWQPAGGSSVRYAATTTPEGRWRGEVAIPWKLVCGERAELPVMLRFNFCQHRAANCESASWAGPVDFGRDEALTGLLYLRTPADAGIAGTARQDPDQQ